MGNSDDALHRSPSTVDTNEFFFPGRGLSALLIHGLTGTPYEMRFLGERLAGAGACVRSEARRPRKNVLVGQIAACLGEEHHATAKLLEPMSR